jgi:DNA-binding NtrC family response regulator
LGLVTGITDKENEQAMRNEPVKVLLIEDSEADARLIREMFSESRRVSFDVVWVDLVATGLNYLAADRFDVVLLDLHLPDTYGLITLGRVRATAPAIPVVVLTSFNDEDRAVSAIQEGAQGYLIKGQVDGKLLMRSLLQAIELNRIRVTLQKTRDELERRVKELTVALAQTKEELLKETAARKQAETALQAEREAKQEASQK